MPKVNCKLVSWDEVVGWCWRLADVIKKSGWKPDVLVAIARGGYVPARLLCDYLGVSDLLSIQIIHWPSAAEVAEKARVKYPLNANFSGKKVLVVDDIADTGDSIVLAKEYVEGNCKPSSIKVATMQWISSVCKVKPDYYVEEVREWIWYQYPWTRLEDLSNFLYKIMKEQKGAKPEWSLDELITVFPEHYGFTLDRAWFEEAMKQLVESGLVELTGRSYRLIA